MLRASTGSEENALDAHGVVDGADNVDARIPAGEELVRFTDAVVGGDDALIDKTRADLMAVVSPEEFVDAAGVVGNFERMVRIADGTGIALDDWVTDMSADLREDLGLNEFASAAYTLSGRDAD